MALSLLCALDSLRCSGKTRINILQLEVRRAQPISQQTGGLWERKSVLGIEIAHEIKF